MTLIYAYPDAGSGKNGIKNFDGLRVEVIQVLSWNAYVKNPMLANLLGPLSGARNMFSLF